MKRIYLLAAFCLPMAAGANESALEILARIVTAFKAHESLSYTATLHWKPATSNDTLAPVTATVHLLRDSRDTLWGGYYWIGKDTRYNSYGFYDCEHRYIVLERIRLAYKEEPTSVFGLYHLYNGFMPVPFLKVQDLEKEFATSTATRLPDTVVGGVACLAVRYTLQDYYGPREVQLYVSAKDHLPVLRKEWWTYDPGKIQYSEFRFLAMEFDKVTREQFSPAQIPGDYKIEAR
ncbi:MAG: hypothetical protein JNL72_03005 [Flavipsychrobacter sp.]|nr:hypothetical protein [Flavipsychrobacter sp.]